MSGVILEVLFVPRKAETLSVVRRAAESMDLNLHVCTDPDEVERLLFCHRYDGLVVDHDSSTEIVMRALRQSPSSRAAIAIDIHDASINLQSVFALGANFEIVTPLTVERVRRTLHLAQGLMMLGRRRYYRHPVDIPVQISSNGHHFNATLSNVSESGLSIRAEGITLVAGPLQCTFIMPECSTKVVIEATVVWADKTGQAGCRIEHITTGRDQYLDWICRLFHKETIALALSVQSYGSASEVAPGIGV
jgi:hypothetical protein